MYEDSVRARMNDNEKNITGDANNLEARIAAGGLIYGDANNLEGRTATYRDARTLVLASEVAAAEPKEDEANA
jgi:hypothetical protein